MADSDGGRRSSTMVINPVTWSGSPRRSSSSSSATLLCFSGMALMFSVLLMCLAFACDHWQELDVRDDVERARPQSEWRARDRNEGLFHICFDVNTSEDKNDFNTVMVAGVEVELFPSLFGNQYCFSKADLVFDPNQRLTRAAEKWQTLIRLCVALYSIYFMFSGIACVVFISACWNCSRLQMRVTAGLLIVAGLAAALGLLLWHSALFQQNHRVYDARLAFRMSWPVNLQDRTKLSLGVCHTMATASMLLVLVASLLLIIASALLKDEKPRSPDQTMAFDSFHASPSFYRPVRRSNTLSSTLSSSLSSRKSRIDYYGAPVDMERLNGAHVPRTATLKKYTMVVQELKGNNRNHY